MALCDIIWYNERFYFEAVRCFVYFCSCAIYRNTCKLHYYSQDFAFSKARLKIKTYIFEISFVKIIFHCVDKLLNEIAICTNSAVIVRCHSWSCCGEINRTGHTVLEPHCKVSIVPASFGTFFTNH